jgi:hypothetical protein
MEKIRTAAQAANELKAPYSTVTYHLRKLGVQRIGRDWIITDSVMILLRESLGRGRGTHEKTGND